MLPITNPAPVLRRAFTLPRGGRITRARLHLSAAGNVTFTVNGDPITVDGKPATRDATSVPRLLTDQSTYDRTVLYDTFDVTALLRAGRENVVAAELRRGWYGVTTPHGRIDLAVTIPYNTEAEIWVPTQDQPVTAPRGAAFVRDATSGGAAYRVYRARAGSYRFNAR